MVVEAEGLGLGAAEEAVPDIVEVRRDAVPRVEVRRLSSSETEEVGRWAEEVAVVEVRLAAVEVAVGRVGGLLSPPVTVPVRGEEVAAGLVAVEDVAGRRAAVVVVAGFFATEVAVLVPVAAAGFFAGAAGAAAAAGAGDLDFSAGASAGGSSAAAGSASTVAASTAASTGASEGASSCCTTS